MPDATDSFLERLREEMRTLLESEYDIQRPRKESGPGEDQMQPELAAEAEALAEDIDRDREELQPTTDVYDVRPEPMPVEETSMGQRRAEAEPLPGTERPQFTAPAQAPDSPMNAYQPDLSAEAEALSAGIDASNHVQVEEAGYPQRLTSTEPLAAPQRTRRQISDEMEMASRTFAGDIDQTYPEPRSAGSRQDSFAHDRAPRPDRLQLDHQIAVDVRPDTEMVEELAARMHEPFQLAMNELENRLRDELDARIERRDLRQVF